MQQSPAKRPRVVKANTSAKATQTSERHPASPIPDSADRKSKSERSDSRIATSPTSPPREPHQQSARSSLQRETVSSPRPRAVTNGYKNDKGPSETPQHDEKQRPTEANSPAISAAQASPSEELPQREFPNAPARRPLQKRHREPSSPFASTPPTPQTVTVNNITPPEQTPIRAPPRIVDTVGRSCLVDQRGRTPRQYPESGRDDGSENGIGETWPPVRLAKGKKRADTNRPSHTVEQHHPFSQIQKTSQPDASARAVERQEVDNSRSKHDQSTHRPHNGPHVPAERALRPPSRSAAPGPEPEPNAETKATPPRASTPSPTAGMQPSSLGRVSLRPLNGSRLEQVPSVDLTAFSASTSHRPSRSASRIRARRSLPAHLTSLSRNASARPSMWPNSRYSSPFFARPHRQSHSEHASTISNVNTAPAHPFPTSAFTFTPPLYLPVQAPPANATPPLRNHGHSRPTDTLLTPHPPDVPLAAAQGLTSILSAMSVNHGLALDVVIAVYKRAGSLRETDRVLEGMREAAEEWAESALKRMGHRRDSCDRADTDEYYELEPQYRKENGDVEDTGTQQSLSRRRSHRGSQPRSRPSTTELDYVPVPPSVETSEYSPPETTKAAEWKRRSMGWTSRSPVDVHGNDNTIQSSKDENDEGERGQVEQMLVIGGADEEGTSVENHRVSQIPVTPGELPQDSGPDIGALLRNMAPQELEKELGRDNLRRQIGNLFKANCTH
ncbi:hypothetical protein EDC04DRAFT_745186 [Pisolithus marmoratus]|nr:hypothetical protein EDC04DRAFT_745186 [Pisolithus marmoratus]